MMDHSRSWNTRHGLVKLGRRPRTFGHVTPLTALRALRGTPLPTLPTGPFSNAKSPDIAHMFLNNELGDCLVEGTVISAAPGLIKAYRIPYEGPVIRIETGTGKRLTTTRNHAVLTSRGFVAAHLLQEGDYVLSTDLPQVVASGMGDDLVHAPTRVEDVFESLQGIGLPAHIKGQMRPAVDFHGDARFFKSEVCVVNSDRFLKDRDATALREPKSQQSLVLTPWFSKTFYSERALHPHLWAVDAPATSYLGGQSEGSFLFGTPPIRAKLRRFGSRPYLYASQRKVSHNKFPADAELPGELIGRFPSEIVLDQIVKVERGEWIGHVYDLSTVPQWYIADGIITHNCTCAGMANFIELVTADAQGTEAKISNKEVEIAYEAFGYRPGVPSTDQGANEQDVLRWWQDTGFPTASGRVKAEAVFEVNPADVNGLAEIIMEFGAAYIGIVIPNGFMDATSEGPPTLWEDSPSFSGVEGGHCVLLHGFDRSSGNPSTYLYDVTTWGTNAVYKARGDFLAKYLSEAYGVFLPQWVTTTGKTPYGMTAEQLCALGDEVDEDLAAT